MLLPWSIEAAMGFVAQGRSDLVMKRADRRAKNGSKSMHNRLDVHSYLLQRKLVRSSHRCLAMAAHGAAPAAAALAAVPPKVQALLKHVEEKHPMTLSSGSIPMIYARDVEVPLPEVAQALLQHPEELVGPQAWRAAQGSEGGRAHVEHHAHVLQALVAVAFGALDLAHNLVTPLSWGSPTEYGGPPVRNSTAAQDAAYVHALVHRWEGEHDGEFGSGFTNANYWYRAAGPHPVLRALQPVAAELAGGDPALQRYVAAGGGGPGAPAVDPTRLVTLCSEALRTRDAKLLAFANQVLESEWRTLFLMTLRKAQQPPPVATS